MLGRPIAALCSLAILGIALAAQTPELGPDRPPDQPPLLPHVVYKQFFPGADPQFFAVTVDSTGSAGYQSHGPDTPSPTSLPYEPGIFKFTMSEQTRDRIFELAREARYFDGDFEYRRNRVASTGQKTLEYADAQRRHSTTYNYSDNSAIRELTGIFQSLSNTLEAGRRLRYRRKYDRLGIEAELRALEDQAKNKQLAELHLIEPLLRELARDPMVMKIARDRAQRLLRRAGDQNPGGGQK